MRQVELIPVEHLREATALYGNFDLDIAFGRPTTAWERRNLHSVRAPFALQNVWFPELWHRRVWVNKRAAEALLQSLNELQQHWTLEALTAHGLNKFVRCYSFGCSKEPNLFWYGAGWELSQQVGGEPLAEAIKIFQRHGWTYLGHTDKRRIREFEFW